MGAWRPYRQLCLRVVFTFKKGSSPCPPLLSFDGSRVDAQCSEVLGSWWDAFHLNRVTE